MPFAKVKSRLDAETMNSAQVERARVEHGFCVEQCLFCFLFSVFCLLSRVSLKHGFLLCHFFFKCIPILFVFLFVGCTLCAHSSVVSMFCDLCVCVSCACIDCTVERQVSVVIVSGFFFFFSRARRMQTFILGFSYWLLYLILGNFVLRVAAFVPSMIVRRFWTAVS